VPAFFIQHQWRMNDRLALACYLATELPLVVVITGIGVQTGRLKSSTSAALVAAAMLSVLTLPLVAARLRASVEDP
jgi:Kef-type K+ transport system membrane component KefB